MLCPMTRLALLSPTTAHPTVVLGVQGSPPKKAQKVPPPAAKLFPSFLPSKLSNAWWLAVNEAHKVPPPTAPTTLAPST